MDAAIAQLRAAGEPGAAALAMAQKLIGNVLAKQDDPKFRRVKTSNPKLQAALFSIPGGRELMRAAGFEDEAGGDELVLPANASLVTLRLRLHAIDEALKPAAAPPSAPPPRAAASPARAAPAAAPPPAPPPPPPAATDMDVDEEDEEAMLQQALLLSQQQAGGGGGGGGGNGGGGNGADEDEEDMLQRALALSREDNGMAAAPRD